MDLRKAVRDPWVWGQLVLIGLVGAGIPLAAARQWPLLAPAAPGWRLPGIVIFGLGVGIALLGVRSLGPNLTPGTEPMASGRMVETGAYRHVRHPVYLGLILILAGWAWWHSNAWLGLLVGLLGFGYFDRKAAAEERWMLRRFPAYAAYRARVPKLIPRLRRPAVG